MSHNCCSPSQSADAVCDMPVTSIAKPAHTPAGCPVCGRAGKPVDAQTLKALVSVSLRLVHEADYLFCRTPDCPVVYFSPTGARTFTTDDVRERVYQKAPDADDVFACYCFRYTVGDIRAASPRRRADMLDDINTGIQLGQCACELRNPQGACCLGNVRAVMKQAERRQPALAVAS